MGAFALAVAGWSAVTARRPPWLSEKSIKPGAERRWAAGIGLAALGLVCLGAVDLDLASGALRVVALVLIGIGVFLVVGAAPRTRAKR